MIEVHMSHEGRPEIFVGTEEVVDLDPFPCVDQHTGRIIVDLVFDSEEMGLTAAMWVRLLIPDAHVTIDGD